MSDNDLDTVEGRARQAQKITYATQEARNNVGEAYAWVREVRRCSPYLSDIEGRAEMLTRLLDFVRGELNDVNACVAMWVTQGDDR